MSCYWNGAGQRFALPELPLEPPDCWAPAAGENDMTEEADADDE